MHDWLLLPICFQFVFFFKSTTNSQNHGHKCDMTICSTSYYVSIQHEININMTRNSICFQFVFFFKSTLILIHSKLIRACVLSGKATREFTGKYPHLSQCLLVLSAQNQDCNRLKNSNGLIKTF